MKSLKLCNWKLALFALGACVVATPVILSSCSSAAETVSGNFVAFTTEEDYDQGKCSDEKFTIDGTNVTANAAGYGNLVFKLDNELKPVNKMNGKDVPSLTSPEQAEEFINSLPDSFTYDQVIYMGAYVSDNYLSNQQAEVYLASPDNLPKALAICDLGVDDSFSPISYLSLNYFNGVDGNPVPAGQSVDMYITLIKLSASGKMTKGQQPPTPTYSAVRVSKFTFTYDPAAPAA